MTLQADFYDRPLQYHAFGAALRECTEVVLPLTPDEIARTVSGPLERSGMDIEPELVAALVADAGQRPGALPLLQYTLTDLFERRGAARLTMAAHRTIGGIAGAVAHRADNLYELLESADRDATRQIFIPDDRCFVLTGGDGAACVRRYADVDDWGVVSPQPPLDGAGGAVPDAHAAIVIPGNHHWCAIGAGKTAHRAGGGRQAAHQRASGCIIRRDRAVACNNEQRAPTGGQIEVSLGAVRLNLPASRFAGMEIVAPDGGVAAAAAHKRAMWIDRQTDDVAAAIAKTAHQRPILETPEQNGAIPAAAQQESPIGGKRQRADRALVPCKPPDGEVGAERATQRLIPLRRVAYVE